MAAAHALTSDTHTRVAATVPKPASLLPRGAFDSHVHVFDPTIGPYASNRAYTPEDAPLDRLIAFNKSISKYGTGSSIVLVQPSPYKSDCTVLLKCLQELQNQKRAAYGIAVVDVQAIQDTELERMHKLGVRGIRLNFQADGKGVDIPGLMASLRTAAARIAHLPGWIIQLFVPGFVWDNIFDGVRTLPVPIIADHLGGMRGASKLGPDLAENPLQQPGFNSLVRLAQMSKLIIKVSGLYRASGSTETCYHDTRPIIETLSREVPDQCIWGSDWPHTGEGKDRVNGDLGVKEPFRSIDDAAILENVREWVGGEGAWQKLMTDNPSRLFQ
ncbi:uncharacterized protein APUU_10268A [Aspergillus puulaauensis]|uniref:Amidohydrolase-related domain-containing protein n=1 Tax=Aspergillus puulaauensis TaxID=1220207 RepID=A0A7R8AHC6_9EURO|nr:uncharacterized protein APUU_10268A [Aspergillus puulaauensis]BCS17440.1 hypothetical protein APUU_10268A [Aspergillus puulaauensis]